jgi:HK97 family phage major capsid protein
MTTATTDFDLPPIDSGLILSKINDLSAVQKISQRIDLPGTGVIVHNFSTGDASYVPEGGRKPLTQQNASSLTVAPAKFTKVITITDELSTDSPALANAIYGELPKSFAPTFDRIVIGDLLKPSGDFDNLSGAPTQGLNTVADGYAAYSAVEAKGVNPEAWLFTSAKFNELAGKVTDLGIPVFDFSNGEFLGLPYAVVRSTVKAAWVGPFQTRSVWGVVDGTPSVKISKDATLVDDDGTIIPLFQENKIGVIAEVRFGFRVADINEFVKLDSVVAS